MSAGTFYMWLGIAFLLGAWGYRLLQSQIHYGRRARTGVVCSLCEEPPLALDKCLRCKSHVCTDCRWDLLTPEGRDEIFPRRRRVVCVKCATKAEGEAFKELPAE